MLVLGVSFVHFHRAVALAGVVLRHGKANPFGYTGLIGLGRRDDEMIW